MNIVRGDGLVLPYKEYKNPWLFSMFNWNHLGEKYVPKKPNELSELWTYRVFIGGQCKDIFSLFSEPKITHEDRLALGMTLDGMVVRLAEFEDFVAVVRRFRATMKTQATHLDQIATDIDELRLKFQNDGFDVIGVSWWQSTMSDNFWEKKTRKKDEYRPYNLNKDRGHYFLYDEVAKIEESFATA